MRSTARPKMLIMASILVAVGAVLFGLTSRQESKLTPSTPQIEEFEPSVSQADRRAIIDYVRQSIGTQVDPDGNPPRDAGTIVIETGDGKTITNRPSKLRIGKVLPGTNAVVYEDGERLPIPGDVHPN